MEGLKKAVGDAMGKNEYFGISKAVAAAASNSSDHSPLLLNRSPSSSSSSSRRVVSLLTCSKLCAFCFVAGIVVGFTLKRRVRRWASTLLRRFKDD